MSRFKNDFFTGKNKPVVSTFDLYCRFLLGSFDQALQIKFLKNLCTILPLMLQRNDIKSNSKEKVRLIIHYSRLSKIKKCFYACYKKVQFIKNRSIEILFIISKNRALIILRLISTNKCTVSAKMTLKAATNRKIILTQILKKSRQLRFCLLIKKNY